MRLLLLITILFTTLVYAELAEAATELTDVPAESANELKDEGSPYLQQHAHNPVHWYPWESRALKKAKQEHKPIFLSIGYSTCHWCHVMAHESFENDKIAQLINKDFIAIKVDREELPHLDKYYQNIHLLLKKRSGGWPLTAILTEDAKPFFVGTYIPPEKKYGFEGLDTLLPRLAAAYKKEKSKLLAQASAIERMVDDIDRAELEPVKIELSIAKDIFKGLQEQFDELYYGFSRRPKFPESSKISLLFDLDRLGIEGAKEMALNVLRAMALRGLYDQVEGGFFRYSVDAAWEIPHFEKMLYTNAELIPLYVRAYELTGDELYKQVVTETIEMVEKRFEDSGLYLSASDADSGDEEGGYFIYSYDEMSRGLDILKSEEREELTEILDLSEIGNFEGKTHINFYAQERPESFQKVKARLKKIRESREYPFIDKKVNTAWNAMMIEALFYASAIDKKYETYAQRSISSLLQTMYLKGTLYHQSLLGRVPVQRALLEDYAFLTAALLRGYEENYDEQYLFLAKLFSDEAVKKFYENKLWYLSDDGLEIGAGMSDKYYTAPMNKMLLSLLKVASLTGERRYLSIVQESLERKSALLHKTPSVFAGAMQVLLREKRGYITLKADKQNLLASKREMRMIRYPFLLGKADAEAKAFLACDMGQCFGINKELKKIISVIETR